MSDMDSDRLAQIEMRLKAAEADLVTLDARCRHQAQQLEAFARKLADLRAARHRDSA